jgi:hypothetical protein
MTGVRRSRFSATSFTHNNLAITTVAGIVIAGCAATAPTFVPGVQSTSIAATSASLEQAQRLTNALALRGQWMTSLQTPAVMEYNDGRQHLKTRETILVRRPACLRVEAFSALGVAAIVTANDTQIAVFNASSNTLTTGGATAQTLSRFVQIPMAPRQAVNLLMGLVPEPQGLDGKIDSVRIEGDLTIVSFAKGDGSRTELGFAGADLELARQKMADQTLSYEVHYADYREIGGTSFPYELDARFPMAGTQVKFYYKRPIVNGAIEETAFVLAPSKDTKQISLDPPTLSLIAPEEAGSIED